LSNAQNTLINYQNQRPQLQNILNTATSTLQALQNNAINQGTIGQVVAQITQLQNSINADQVNIQNLRNQINILNQQLVTLQNQITIAQNTKTQVQAQLHVY
jgi:phage shock protein A